MNVVGVSIYESQAKIAMDDCNVLQTVNAFRFGEGRLEQVNCASCHSLTCTFNRFPSSGNIFIDVSC